MTDMPARFTVVDPASSFRRGLAGVLAAAGYVVVDPGDGPEVALVTLRSEEDAAMVESMAVQCPVLALVPGLDGPGYAHALSHGAAAAVDWHADPEQIAGAAVAVLQGNAIVSVRVLREIADVEGAHGADTGLTGEEIDWLERLAAGATVVQVAYQAGYSERAMFRRLHDVYRRLGVSGRAEALVAAQRLGLLDKPR